MATTRDTTQKTRVTSSIRGTLSEYDKQIALGKEVAKLTDDLLKQFAPEAVAQPSAEKFFAPLLEEQAKQPPPEAQPVPAAPRFDTSMLLSLLASQLGGQITGRQGLAQPALVERLRERKDIERENLEQRNRFNAERWANYYATKAKTLEVAWERAVAEADSDKAQGLQDQHFKAKAALDAINEAIGRQSDFELRRMVESGETERTRLRIADEGRKAADTTLRDRRQALADLNRVAAGLAAKIKDEKKGFLGLGGKRITEEEFRAQLGNVSSYITFGDAEVENAAHRHLINVLNTRYGADEQKKRDALASAGIELHVPLRAPTGEIRFVPESRAENFIGRGAKRLQ